LTQNCHIAVTSIGTGTSGEKTFQQGIIGRYQIYQVDGVNGRLTLQYIFVICGGLRSGEILND
jgi:hypothetical protein